VGIKAIIGGDAVVIAPKYRDAYSTNIPAVILAVNKNPMRFTDHSGGVSRRRVILTFPEVILEKSVTHSYSTNQRRAGRHCSPPDAALRITR